MSGNNSDAVIDGPAAIAASSSSDDSSSDNQRRSKSTSKKRSAPHADTNGISHSFSMRRHSLSKAARDPRDEPSFKKRVVGDGQSQLVRQPSPVIAADGLSRASMSPHPAYQGTAFACCSRLRLQVSRNIGAIASRRIDKTQLLTLLQPRVLESDSTKARKRPKNA